MAVITVIAEVRPRDVRVGTSPWRSRVVLTRLNSEEWSWQPYTADGFGTQPQIAWLEWITTPAPLR